MIHDLGHPYTSCSVLIQSGKIIKCNESASQQIDFLIELSVIRDKNGTVNDFSGIGIARVNAS